MKTPKAIFKTFISTSLISISLAASPLVAAETLEKEGIAFIGPKPLAINAMGDKIESKKLAMEAGVNVVPGFVGEIEIETELWIDECVGHGKFGAHIFFVKDAIPFVCNL